MNLLKSEECKFDPLEDIDEIRDLYNEKLGGLIHNNVCEKSTNSPLIGCENDCARIYMGVALRLSAKYKEITHSELVKNWEYYYKQLDL